MKDDALIERFLSGDEQGFTMLVEKYKDKIVNIVYSLSSQTQHADDIAQEVFIKVYQHLSAFKKRSEFATWLYRITVNTTYNYLKKMGRLVPLDSSVLAAILRKDAADDLGANERKQLLEQALNSLPFNFRSVIVLKEIEGLSYKEIAKVLGMRLGTVESRLFRARQMLKEKLAPVLKEGLLNVVQ
ncbi:sigma-70 family RNA polymerase sigma factor [Candidatus Omnitrophota bacterium]